MEAGGGKEGRGGKETGAESKRNSGGVLADDRADVTNVVLMGMGEPLANYANTMAAVATLNDPDSKLTWSQMAERWHRCAELAQKYDSEMHKKTRQHRKSAQHWSH